MTLLFLKRMAPRSGEFCFSFFDLFWCAVVAAVGFVSFWFLQAFANYIIFWPLCPVQIRPPSELIRTRCRRRFWGISMRQRTGGFPRPLGFFPRTGSFYTESPDNKRWNRFRLETFHAPGSWYPNYLIKSNTFLSICQGKDCFFGWISQFLDIIPIFFPVQPAEIPIFSVIFFWQNTLTGIHLSCRRILPAWHQRFKL